MKCDNVVKVIVNYCGQDKEALVGYYIRGKLKLVHDKEGSHWEETDEPELIFGYCGNDPFMTHMCYGSSYVNWQEMLEDVRTKHSGRMYFDAGSNGRPLWISYDELKKAFDELDITKVSGQEITCKD